LEIQFNGNPLTIDGIDAETTVADIISLIQEEIGHQGMSIVDVDVDGEVLDVDEPKLSSLSVGACQVLKVFGTTVSDLISQALADRREVFSHLDAVGKLVAESLRTGQVGPAMEHHLELIEGLTWVVSIMENLGKAFPEKMVESDLELRRQGQIAKLNEQMKLLQEAQENQDWVGAADLIEYELPELLNAGRDFFDLFADH
jgi:hypothetical protein